ncbi:conserved hypothetical protein [Neospora caninum Liverpool]|uniref:Uncharacterized protein n=1 Tax=Neospora caninum (strain Liverpool) TaxID=572307 RepID=F0VD65_NEOCL|nr:conserved hypothetical protein [Neospora caninum Liverpool]CBZ51580.1 conserved hypothetical protein [Neospora caninum Liverpool]|eukprot:XP_003881613.1 conserved hypothetical protein [Neospora caninum Liverpool]
MDPLRDRPSHPETTSAASGDCEVSWHVCPGELFSNVAEGGRNTLYNDDKDSFCTIRNTLEAHPGTSVNGAWQGSVRRSSFPALTLADTPSMLCSGLTSPSVHGKMPHGGVPRVHLDAPKNLQILDGQTEEIQAFLELLLAFAAALVSALEEPGHEASEGDFSSFPSVAVLQLFGAAVSGPTDVSGGRDAHAQEGKPSSRGSEAPVPGGNSSGDACSSPVLRAASLLSELHQAFVHLVADSSTSSAQLQARAIVPPNEAAGPRDVWAEPEEGRHAHCVMHHPRGRVLVQRETELYREAHDLDRQWELGMQFSDESSGDSGTDTATDHDGEAEASARAGSGSLAGSAHADACVHTGSGVHARRDELLSRQENEGSCGARDASSRSAGSDLGAENAPKKAEAPTAFRSRAKRLLRGQRRKRRHERRVLGQLARAVSLCCALRSSPTAFSAFLLLVLSSPADYQDSLFHALASWWRLCDQAEPVAVLADAKDSAAALAVTEALESVGEARDLLLAHASFARCPAPRTRGDEAEAAEVGRTGARNVGEASRGQEREREARQGRETTDQSVGEEDGERGTLESAMHRRCSCCPFASLSRAECVEYVRGFLASLIPFLLWMYTSRCLLPAHKLCMLHNFLAGLEASRLFSHSAQPPGRGGSAAEPRRPGVSLSAVETAIQSPLFLSDPPDNLSGLEDFLLLLAAAPSPLASAGTAQPVSSAKRSGEAAVSPLASGLPVVSLGAAVSATAPHAILNLPASGAADFGQLLLSSSLAASGAAAATGSCRLRAALFPWAAPDTLEDLSQGCLFETSTNSTALSTPFSSVNSAAARAAAAEVFSAQQQASDDFVQVLTGRWQRSQQLHQTHNKADLDIQRMADETGSWGFAGLGENKVHQDRDAAEGKRPCIVHDVQHAQAGHVPGARLSLDAGNAAAGHPLGSLLSDRDQEGGEKGGVSQGGEETVGAIGRGDLRGGEETKIIGSDTPFHLDSEELPESRTSQRTGDDNDKRLVLLRGAVGPPLARITAERQQELLARCLATFSFYSGVCSAVEERVMDGFLTADGHGNTENDVCQIRSPSRGGLGGSTLDVKERSASGSGREIDSDAEPGKWDNVALDEGALNVAALASQREEDIFLSVQEHVDFVAAAFLSSIAQYDVFESVSLHHALPQPLLPLLLQETRQPTEDHLMPNGAFRDSTDTGIAEAERRRISPSPEFSAGCPCAACRQSVLALSAYVDTADDGEPDGRGLGEPGDCPGESEEAKIRTSRIIEAALYGDSGVPAKSQSDVLNSSASPSTNLLSTDNQMSGLHRRQQLSRNSALCTRDELLEQSVDPWRTGRVRMPVSEFLMLQIGGTLGRLLFRSEQRIAAARASAGNSFAWRSCLGGERRRSANSEAIQSGVSLRDAHDDLGESKWWQDVVRPAIREQRLLVEDLFLDKIKGVFDMLMGDAGARADKEQMMEANRQSENEEAVPSWAWMSIPSVLHVLPVKDVAGLVPLA